MNVTSASAPSSLSMGERRSLYAAAWIDREGVPLDLIGRSVSVLVIMYVMMNRLISDRFVLPVGISIRLYEVVLVAAAVAWALWMLREPHPFPLGLPGLFGMLAFVLIGLAPFIHATTLSDFQANAAERGLFRLFILATLFIASFHLAFRVREGMRLLGWLVAATAMQAAFGIYEYVTAKPVVFLDAVATSIGLIPDPKSVRGEYEAVFQRLTGEIRAVATAPHPIVLSAVIAVGVLVVVTWLIYAGRRRTAGWVAVAGAIIALALPVTNSRTAFVILMAAAIPFIILHVEQLPKLLLWALPFLLVLGVAFAISPRTPRLLLNSITNPGEDQNTTVRIERFSRVPELVSERPVLGAGYLTHDTNIQLFDNAYNKAIIEFGIVGFAVVISFFLSALAWCWRATTRAGPREVVLPAVGVVAAISLFAAAATFDAWTFDQFFPTCLLLLGLGLGRSSVILHRERESANVGSAR